MKRYDALCFDLDGTLWNASATSAKGWNTALKALGVLSPPLSGKDVERVAGHPFEKCANILLPHISLHHYPNLIEMLKRYEHRAVECEGGSLYDGVVDGIKALSQYYPIFLISNCQDWYLRCFFEHSGLYLFFSDANCYGRAQQPKHEMIREMMAHWQCSSALYIGDTSGDQQAARKAGVDFGYVSYGFGTSCDPEHTFTSFHDICTRFLTWKNAGK